MIEKQPISFARKRPGYRGRKRATPCFANGWCASYSAAKGGENPRALLEQGGKAELHFLQLCGYSAATLRRKAEEEQTPPPGRDGRVAFLATLRLLCGGGWKEHPRRPSCCDEAGRATLRLAALARRAGSHFPTLRLLCGTCEH